MKKIKKQVLIRKELREIDGKIMIRNKHEDHYLTVNLTQKVKPSTLKSYPQDDQSNGAGSDI